MNTHDFERLKYGFQRCLMTVFNPGKFPRQTSHPVIRRTEWLPIQRTERPKETDGSLGKMPVSKSLIQKRRAESNQNFVDKQIAVFACRTQQQVAMAHRARRRAGNLFGAVDAVAADAPKRMQRECLPRFRTPVLDRGIAEL